MDFAESQRNPGKHPIGLIVVVIMHVILGYALVNGLARKIVDVVKAPIETKIIEEVKPPPPPPPENLPPPPKNLPPPPAFVPPPEVQVTPQPTVAPTITTTTVAPPPTEVKISQAPPAVKAPPAPAVQPKPAIADVHACAPTADDYPPAAIRAEATGTTKIRFTIDANGALVKTEVVHSAGPTREHKMLDRVAVSKLSECKFKAAIDAQGKPVGGSFDVDYVWNLN